MSSSVPVVIVLCPWRSGADATQMLESAVETAPHSGPVVWAGDAFASGVNQISRQHADADLAIIADAWRPPEGWLPRLRQAVYADDTVAAASPLASGLGDPPFASYEDDPLFHRTFDGAPAQSQRERREPVDPGTHPLHPRMARLWPHCTYIRRSALDLLGCFDESLTHPTAVLGEFAARAMGRGLSCVLADDAIGARPADGLPPCPPEEIARVIGRHPWIADVREEEAALEVGPLKRSLLTARVTGRELSITIDARALGETAAGTQNYIHGLVMAFGRTGRLVRVLVNNAAPRRLCDELKAAGLRVLTESQAIETQDRTDIAHRPQQAFVPEDLGLLRRLGERVVITHLDLIGYRNPNYHTSPQEWRRYRRLTRFALGAADRVVFLSEHARHDAIAEELIEPDWTAVVGAGITPAIEPPPQRRPERVPGGRPFVVLIGADYFHKNRLFALALLDEWTRRHHWDGILVLAGNHVSSGGSAAAEAELLANRPDLAPRVVDVGRVEEDEKQWLLGHASGLLCPSVYEGFGLTPLEAAAAGIPCVYAATTSLAEIIAPAAATILPWRAEASAERALPLLHPGDERERHLAMLRDALPRYEWGSIVAQLCRVYEQALHDPYRSSVPRAWEELQREQLIVDLDQAREELNSSLLDLDHAYKDLRRRVDYGIALIDQDGLLSRRQQRGLMRVATRRWLSWPLLGPLGFLGGLGANRDSGKKR